MASLSELYFSVFGNAVESNTKEYCIEQNVNKSKDKVIKEIK
ncbi:MAG: hypothetical protein ACYDEE_07315 [Ignavibacteriaceae bacterium]